MISLLEAQNYRCLHYVSRPLDSFHVLVGPNASGKTTFLDVVSFMGDLVSSGLEAAITERTANFQDLVWGRREGHFELALEAAIPQDRCALLGNQPYNSIRYEIKIGPDQEEIGILAERVLLKKTGMHSLRQVNLFPSFQAGPSSILTERTKKGESRTVVNKVYGGNDNFYSEVYPEHGKGWAPAFKLGPRKSALGNLPEDESKFPVTTWFRRLLTEGVQLFVLNSMLIRKPSPPGQVRGFKPDGSNLPWVISGLKEKSPGQFAEWIMHLRTALPDLTDIEVVTREEDRHKYLVLKYGELDIPSWMASDGTLRLLALTVPAYIPDFSGVYLIEEPENGIHPRAVETIFQSLSSVYGAQILMATHSPVILGMADASSVLCFAKTTEGATDIVSGSEHPALKEWQGETNLGTLFASGVLG